MIQILFLVIAALGLLAALGTVLARNLVHAALFLVAFFFIDRLPVRAAGGRVPGGDPGAGLHRRGGDPADVRDHADPEHPGGRHDDRSPVWKVPALVAGLALRRPGLRDQQRRSAPAGRASWSQTDARPSIAPEPAGQADGRRGRAGRSTTWAKAVGDEMMTRYVVPFEVAGLLLTAALVGAIALAHREEDEPSARGRTTAPRRGCGQPARRRRPASATART